MWFTSIYLKTLRDARIAILGWGLGMGLLMYTVLVAYPSLVETPQARASLVSLSSSFAWLADPVAVDTVGGYATFKYGFTILLIAIWPIIVCGRMFRGEEVRGSMDMLLSLPRGRWRVALEKLAAVWTALLAMGLLIGLLAFVGNEKVGADFGLNGALLFGLNLVLTCGVFGSIALLLSQFTREPGTAAGWTGGMLLLFIVLDMVHRITSGTEWLSRLSPVYYYNVSKPLIPSHGVNSGAMLLLLALSILLSSAAVWLFVRRDIGGTVTELNFLRQSKQANQPAYTLPTGDWSLRSIYARSLGMIAVPTCWWTLAITGFAVWIVIVVKQTEANLRTIYDSSPVLKDLVTKVGGGDIVNNATILSALFTFLPLLLMAFAVTQANRWSDDEEEGRLELVLSTPQPRLRVLLGRFAALATATIIISVLTLAITALASVTMDLKLDGGNLIAATLSMIPLGLLVAAIGYLLSGWLSTALETGLLTYLLVIWFFISFVGSALKWPDTTLRLSAFYYYGTPLVHGLPTGDTLIVLVVSVGVLVLATVRFMRKDIAR